MWNTFQTDGRLRACSPRSRPTPAAAATRSTPTSPARSATGRSRASCWCTTCPGWDEFYLRVRPPLRPARLHRRSAPTSTAASGHGTPDDVAAKVRAEGGVADDRWSADCDGAHAPGSSRCRPATARSASSAPARAAATPCSSPAASQGFDAVVDLWGGGVVAPPDAADAEAAGRADRLHEGPERAAARHLRQRRPDPVARPGRPARGRAEEARQGVRVPPLRRRRPRLLLLRPPGLPAAAGDGRLGQGLRRSSTSTSSS